MGKTEVRIQPQLAVKSNKQSDSADSQLNGLPKGKLARPLTDSRPSRQMTRESLFRK